MFVIESVYLEHAYCGGSSHPFARNDADYRSRSSLNCFRLTNTSGVSTVGEHRYVVDYPRRIMIIVTRLMSFGRCRHTNTVNGGETHAVE